MRTALFVVTLALAGLLGSATTVLAQKDRSIPLRSTLEEELSVRRVVWPVFVSAKKAGAEDACHELSPDKVRVIEDGERVTVTSLDRERRPTLYALLIDTSESMSERNSLHLAREAAKLYVDQLQPHESIAVFSFDDIFLLRAPVARMDSLDAKEEVKKAIDAIDASAGLTYLRDALNQLILHVESFPERKVIIVLTDGVDTMSRLPPDRVMGTAMSTPRQNVTIYTVGIGIPTYSGAFVKQLAELTGGTYFGIREPDQISATFQEVRRRLAQESYLSWIPQPFGQGRKDPLDAQYTFREVRIKSLDKRCKIDNPREYRFSSRRPTCGVASDDPVATDRSPLAGRWIRTIRTDRRYRLDARHLRGRGARVGHDVRRGFPGDAVAVVQRGDLRRSAVPGHRAALRRPGRRAPVATRGHPAVLVSQRRATGRCDRRGAKRGSRSRYDVPGTARGPGGELLRLLPALPGVDPGRGICAIGFRTAMMRRSSGFCTRG
jgi:Mg-chelatase subunit ChlD